MKSFADEAKDMLVRGADRSSVVVELTKIVFDAAIEEPTREIWALENFLPR